MATYRELVKDVASLGLLRAKCQHVGKHLGANLTILGELCINAHSGELTAPASPLATTRVTRHYVNGLKVAHGVLAQKVKRDRLGVFVKGQVLHTQGAAAHSVCLVLLLLIAGTQRQHVNNPDGRSHLPGEVEL